MSDDAPKFASMSECRRIATMNPGLMAEKFRELRSAYDSLREENERLKKEVAEVKAAKDHLAEELKVYVIAAMNREYR